MADGPNNNGPHSGQPHGPTSGVDETGDLRAKKIFTTGEAAQLCKVSQQTIIRCFDAGRLQGFRVPGSKFRRIPRDELIRFMRENNIPTDALENSARRVLVVDDDPNIVELFEDLLAGDERIELRTASNGYDAGMLTESFRPHLMVLDFMLPDINGNVVCQRLRSNPEMKDTRVLIVSGVVDRAEVQALLDAGAEAFVKKPFDLDELLATVSRLLELESPIGGG